MPEPIATEIETPIPVTETEAETPASDSQPEVEPIPESTTETPSVGAVAADPVTMSAVVIGGTGAIGRCLIEYLLKNKVNDTFVSHCNELFLVMALVNTKYIYLNVIHNLFE